MEGLSILHDEYLIKALRNKFQIDILSASYSVTALQGGTVANVQLVEGEAVATSGELFPFKIVLKVQHRWERYADSNSWRREYDLYESELAEHFLEDFSWPKCYLAVFNEEKTSYELWLQYIEGTSGLALTPEMLEKVCYKLGEFQGRLFAKQLRFEHLTNVSEQGKVRTSYERFKAWPDVYEYVRSEQCNLPAPIRQLLVEIDESAEQLLASIEQLPVVFCHRDFWNTNIIYCGETFKIIDWDTSGWGYYGEDIASLIIDESDVNTMVECFFLCERAYSEGFANATGITVEKTYIYEMMLLTFGYRLLSSYVHANTTEEKAYYEQLFENVNEIKRLVNVK